MIFKNKPGFPVATDDFDGDIRFEFHFADDVVGVFASRMALVAQGNHVLHPS